MEITRRRFVLVVGFACCFLVILVSYVDNTFGTFGLSWFHATPVLKSQGYLIDTKGCHMPDWDPFDPGVKSLYAALHVPYDCSRKPSFLIVHPNATLHVNDAILSEHHKLQSSLIQCSYQTILRDPGKIDKRTDDQFILTPPKNFTFGVPMGTDFVYVKCYSNGNMFHDEYLPLTPLKPRVEERSEKAALNGSIHEKLNVIIIGIDSISKLNFIRHFKKTRGYLKEHLKAIELFGYNKVADNTFPNLVALLTGHFASHYWNESLNDMFFDEVDFIWRHFQALGYRTLLAEDAPNMATFNYLKKGFKEPPTDYYLRPFSKAVERSPMRTRSKSHCFDDRMEMKVIFDYVRSFVDTMEYRPFFSFSFVARLTHDDLNYAAYADEPAFQLLHYLHSSKITNNSLVIFMSDHGIRFGPIRETFIGKFEDRWPIMFLIFPNWFLQKYPFVARNLKTNQHRLTTAFDIHATLVDVLNVVSGNTPIETKVTLDSKGISLFQEIPRHRTCDLAAILPHWCTCQKLIPVSVEKPEVRLAAVALLDTLNKIISNYTNVCTNLTLDQVKDANLGQPSDQVLRYHRGENDVITIDVDHEPRVSVPTEYLLTVSVSPSSAVFEGTVRYDPTREQHQVLGDISRINRYDHQGDCIQDAKLRKYCYCKKQVLSGA